MIEFFQQLFATDFMPHGYCIRRPEIIWLHEISDGIIALSYFLIPLVLIYLARIRRDLVYPWMFWLFGLFILSCGTTHILSIYVLWHPVYRLDGLVKAITAMASFPTALLLIRLVPKVRLLPSADQLRQQNAVLETEVAERKRAEAEVRRLNAELEHRVAERTGELERRNADLRKANQDLIAAQQAIRTSEATLSAVLDALPVGVVIADKTGQILRDNAAHRDLWGSVDGVVEGDSVPQQAGFWPETGQPIQPEQWAIARALSRGETVKGELIECRAPGSSERRFYINNAAPVYDPHGVIIAGVVAEMDLTERKRAEEAVRASEVEFRNLANAIPQLCWMARPDGYLFWYNQRWYDYTGTTFDQMQGWGWQAVHHPDHVQRVTDGFRACIDRIEPWEDTFPLRSRHGEYRWFLSRALPIRNAQGEVIEWFGTNTDITEQRETELQLRRANADLEQFAFSASHDFQEPLRNVSIYGELLARNYGASLDGQARQFLGFVVEGARRMVRLLDDLLAYTQAANVPAERNESVDAGTVFETTLSILAESITASGAVITHGSLPTVAISGPHLQQIFQNLVGNAIKYRREGTPVQMRIEASRRNGQWVFGVHDNGIGIEQPYQQQIFGLFKRLHPRDKYPGTGIGLAICQRIVERYGGDIWVESEPGQGSNFFFTLPA